MLASAETPTGARMKHTFRTFLLQERNQISCALLLQALGAALPDSSIFRAFEEPSTFDVQPFSLLLRRLAPFSFSWNSQSSRRRSGAFVVEARIKFNLCAMEMMDEVFRICSFSLSVN